MRLTSLKLKGFSSAFPGVVDLPLRDIDPGLVALVGENGGGKTTILEATPAAIYRQLPARGGMPAVDFAVARDAHIDLEYIFDGIGAFRSRVNLDGQTRKTDAVLEQLQPDGSRIPLNDGKVSTYAVEIARRFPSVDLFLNSSFAAQGRGDEFTRATPSKRKDLFVEFLALKRLLAMAKTASDSADLCADARLRLTVQIETLERDTAAPHLQALEQWAQELEAKGRDAETRRSELVTVIAQLEARAQISTDAVAAYAAAQLQWQTVETELSARRRDLEASHRARASFVDTVRADSLDSTRRRDDTVKDLDTRIAGNQQIQHRADGIRAAVAALVTIDADLVTLRATESADQAQRDQVARDLDAAERTVSAFAVPKQNLARAKQDSALLATVPCGGVSPYDGCQFLLNATAAAAKIANLEAHVAGVSAAIADRDTLKVDVERLDGRLAETRAVITTTLTERARQEHHAKYATALAEADVRVAELQTKRTEVLAEAERQATALETRQQARLREFHEQDTTTQGAIDRLTQDQRTAQQDLDAAASGNSQARQLEAELTAARQSWDLVTRTLGEVTSGQAELARRREDLDAKRARRGELLRRLHRIETEQLEWQFFAKALGKGGLPDLEIDAAGPSISATTNSLLVSCYGPRFSIELVTQIEKADGTGMKDEFTVRVLDNDDAGGWRDLSELSGGQKVIVQEALMCAICLYVNERSPLPIRTLFRDETGAALDPENAVRYVAMLRKVRELGGFHHVYFVSHNPTCSDLADTQIRVGGGQARIVQAPFPEAA